MGGKSTEPVGIESDPSEGSWSGNEDSTAYTPAMATETATNPARIQSFFNQLEARKVLLTTMIDLHKTLTSHFTNIQQTLCKKSEALDSQIKAFNSKIHDALENLQNRENALPELESTMTANIAEKKEAAITEIESLGDLNEKSLSEMLKIYCTRMDATGLIRFLQTKRKESAVLRTEIATALENSVDPMRLVLDAAEEFVRMKVEGKTGMADRRWACGMLIQSVVPAVERGYGAGRSLKERAARVLEKWRGVLGGVDRGTRIAAGEATMFLQLVMVFTLKERFEEEFLRKLVMEFADRRDMPKIAVALGFGSKIGDMIEALVKNGKEVEAVYFVSESGLTERYPPVSLLKAYLRNCRRNANNISKKGKFSSAAVEKANYLELEATKSVIKCVEDHKLEQQFSIEELKKRVSELEQAKAEKKKDTAPVNKPSNKRSRGDGSGRRRDLFTIRPVKSVRSSNLSPFCSSNPPQPHLGPPARYSGAYGYTSQSLYEVPSAVPYASAYSGTHSQSPGALPPQYGYALQEAGVSGERAGTSYPGSYGGQSGYSAYDYAAAAAAAPTYPSSYPPQ